MSRQPVRLVSVVAAALLLAGLVVALAAPSAAGAAPAEPAATVATGATSSTLHVPQAETATANATATDRGSRGLGALSFIEMHDTNGVSMWQHQVIVGEPSLFDPVETVAFVIVQLNWSMYVGLVAVSLWLVDLALSFEWLGHVADQAASLGVGLGDTVDAFALTGVFLTVTGVSVALWLARGVYARGVYELLTSCLIAALATTLLIDPVGVVADEGDGLVYGARDVGLTLVAGLDSNGDASSDPDVLRDEVTAQLVDTFVVLPAQLVSFGEILEGTPCGQAYDEAVAGVQGAFSTAVRDAVRSCDPELGAVADEPGLSQVTAYVSFYPAAFSLLGFAVLFSFAIILSALWALYHSLRIVIALVLALLPGAARDPLWLAVGDLAVSLASLAATVTFLGGYLVFLRGVLADQDHRVVMEGFLVIAVLLPVGAVMLLTMRRRLRRRAKDIARWLSKRPVAPVTFAGTAAPGMGLLPRAGQRANDVLGVHAFAGVVHQGVDTMRRRHGAAVARFSAPSATSESRTGHGATAPAAPVPRRGSSGTASPGSRGRSRPATRVAGATGRQAAAARRLELAGRLRAAGSAVAGLPVPGARPAGTAMRAAGGVAAARTAAGGGAAGGGAAGGGAAAARAAAARSATNDTAAAARGRVARALPSQGAGPTRRRRG